MLEFFDQGANLSMLVKVQYIPKLQLSYSLMREIVKMS